MQERKKIVAATDNLYLNIILETLANTKNDQIRTEADVLRKLLKRYDKDSSSKFLGVIPLTSRTHSSNAGKWAAMLKDSGSAAIPEIMKQLNTIKFIKKGGDLGILLSTFFSVYPEHLAQCSDVIKNAVKSDDATYVNLPIDVWKQQIDSWVKAMIDIKRVNSSNDAYEFMDHLSSVIPLHAADAYADYLLAQLQKNIVKENRKGMHKGWVSIALSTLCNKQNYLSLAKRDLVIRTLLSTYANAKISLSAVEVDLSLIGICSALASLSENDISMEQRKEIASTMYTLTVDNLPKSLDLFADNHNETISTYMARWFTTLKALEKQLTEIPRESIVNFLLKNESSYPCRHGILELESWVSNDKKLEFMSRIEIHPQLMKMAALFWKWMQVDKKANTDWSRSNRFFQRMSDIKSELCRKISADSPAFPRVAWLIAENSTSSAVRSEIISNLTEQLSAHNRNASYDQVRLDLHQSLALLRNWASNTQLPAIAKVLQSSVRINPDDSAALKISAATAAAELAEHLRPDDSKQLRNDLLGLLDGPHGKEAAKALSIYISKIPHNQLPELMTCLMLRNNDHAQLLLVGIHAYYQEMSLAAAPALQHAMK